jgi:hypothetical protein
MLQRKTPMATRRKAPKMGVKIPTIVRSDGHMKYVRGCNCAIMGFPGHECSGRMHSHHCREDAPEGSRGGTGMKTGDDTVVPLCDVAHEEIHRKGWRSFERRWLIDLSEFARKLWRDSPHRLKWEEKLRKLSGF